MREHEHPIAAPATAMARSAISVIRCSGTGSMALVSRLFSHPDRLAGAQTQTIHHGTLTSLSGDLLDEVMVAVLRAPATYTGEDQVEIYGHGSPAGVRRILEALYEVGFHPAAPGEFTRRAFLNGKVDLTRAEAVNDVVNADTREAHRLALHRLSGEVQTKVSAIRADLITLMSQLAIQLDYPEEDTGQITLDQALLADCTSRAEALRDTYGRGRLFQDGVAIAFSGRTNAGKSSLFNALLRQDRSIVSEIPGTTRDYLEAMVDICGMPVRLFDTAGLRPPGQRGGGEPVEMEGIRRSRTVISAADLVLYVVDASEGMSTEDENRLAEIRQITPALVVWNKTDLTSAPPPGDFIPVSALTTEGLEALNRRIFTAVSETAFDEGSATQTVVIDSARQHHLLNAALDGLEHVRVSIERDMPADALAVDLQDAINAIGEITGEVVTDEILDAMFGSFCLGK